MGSSIDQAFRRRLSFAIVDDIVKEGAFDEVACQHPTSGSGD
jgi:hypothetical protein